MTTISKEYDIIIVGAGTAGCACAIHAMQKGLDVCIIERKRKEKIGDKVCGDMITYFLFDWMNKYLDLNYLKKGVINNRMNRTESYSPDRKTVLSTKIKICMIDRQGFGQALIDDAIKAGCTLYDSCICTGPVIKDNYVCGITVRDMETSVSSTLRSKIVVDASGAVPALRKKVRLDNSYFENEIEKKDEAFSYREVRKLKKPIKYSTVTKFFFSGTYAEGGYYWIFPQKDDVINIGIGVVRNQETSNMKRNLEKIISKDPIFEGSEVINSGGGILPVRRQLDSFVANGFMCAGDSASQINPISGSGIAQSMMGGHMCADVGAKAIRCGDASQEKLWQLNVMYADRTGREDKGYSRAMIDGASQASTDFLRIFAMGLKDDELNFAMKNFIDPSMLAKAGRGDLSSITLSKKVAMILKSMHKMPLLLKFKKLLDLMENVKELYRIYPKTPDVFPEWKKRLDSVYEGVYKISTGTNKPE